MTDVDFLQQIADDANRYLQQAAAIDAAALRAGQPWEAVPRDLELQLAQVFPFPRDKKKVVGFEDANNASSSQLLWEGFWKTFKREVCDPEGIIQKALKGAGDLVSKGLAGLIGGLLTGAKLVPSVAIGIAASVIAFILLKHGVKVLCEAE